MSLKGMRTASPLVIPNPRRRMRDLAQTRLILFGAKLFKASSVRSLPPLGMT